jgi:CheY-like chemotaxis protein
MDTAITHSVLIELIKVIPSLLWAGFAVFVVVLFYRPLRENVLPHLTGVKAMGVELSFVMSAMDAAIELAEKSPHWHVEVPPHDKEQVLRRVRRHLDLFPQTQWLWIDDHPENNLNERHMFRQLKASIDLAQNTEEALAKVQKRHYDLVISDMRRDTEVTAGLAFLARFRETDQATPVIFYVRVLDSSQGTPAQAFGITNRPDELLHLTLDALERKKS